MILGQYPFLGETLQDTYEKVHKICFYISGDFHFLLSRPCFVELSKWSFLPQIVNNPLVLPDDMNPELKNLIEGLLCKGQWNVFLTNVLSYPAAPIKIPGFPLTLSHVLSFYEGCILHMHLHLRAMGAPQFNLKHLSFAEPNMRMTLKAVAEHTWVIGEYGPVPQYLCWCNRKREESDWSNNDTHTTPTD